MAVVPREFASMSVLVEGFFPNRNSLKRVLHIAGRAFQQSEFLCGNRVQQIPIRRFFGQRQQGSPMVERF